MQQPSKFLIDGIDRLGKSTLIQGILNELGYHLVIHYDKPKKLNYYLKESDYREKESLRQYQFDTNENMFEIIRSTAKVIFDRTHLGEMVYAPLYRGYPGDYVYTMEEQVDGHLPYCRLILLTTSNFDILEDDGESFNWENKVIEQQNFLKAFSRSRFPDKTIIDVHDGKGGYKKPGDILQEALNPTKNCTN